MTHFLFSGQRLIVLLIAIGFSLLFVGSFVPDVPMFIKGLLAVFSVTSLILSLYYVVKEYNKEYAEIK